MLGQRWHLTLGQCNVAHRGMVGLTVGFNVGPTSNYHFTMSIQYWPNMVTPTFEISDIGPMSIN